MKIISNVVRAARDGMMSLMLADAANARARSAALMPPQPSEPSSRASAARSRPWAAARLNQWTAAALSRRTPSPSRYAQPSACCAEGCSCFAAAFQYSAALS
eukprot:CAMPEP_0113282454 /NCGR_PEP_ID=MMETSP0008_2-20120614/28875_1 /TAXON_ID=97485 /ORGANISM="Prymnesium parvum" /LENGTH=101 /DNA_ID=CAMNT_0000133003 /DNA_START=18 /DNA_END=324 /DNA_ORIENTATION=+ /assembly_acc=CAM_ASM_000153